RASACRSASNRASTARLSMPALISLTATNRLTGSVCRAIQTVPIPPSPTSSTSLSLPAMTVPARSVAAWFAAVVPGPPGGGGRGAGGGGGPGPPRQPAGPSVPRRQPPPPGPQAGVRPARRVQVRPPLARVVTLQRADEDVALGHGRCPRGVLYQSMRHPVAD